ncbi:PLP1 Phosducin-like protein 1 [Candida maltosa Xu316]|uniref:Thioredoxin domain-containing protein n=1 Tax=Candida maltosa (strain Xu316) TaxID=1245528 RepID=M3HJ92_CANMX|nr:hypothetical protein G210_2232 [Candida maltosa Xu316]
MKDKSTVHKDESIDNDDTSSLDENELIDFLENETDEYLIKFREERIQQLSNEFKSINHNNNDDDVIDFTNEKQLIDKTITSEKCLIHFYHINFTQCEIMKNLLSQLKKKFPYLEVYSINVDNCPFLIHKLSIKILPVLIFYNFGKEFNRLIGFNKIQPNLSSLENYLYQLNIINKDSLVNHQQQQQVLSDEESDLDIY